MNVEKTVNGSLAVLKPEGWLDTQTSPELEAVVNSLGEEVTDVILDLEKLEYISSAGLRLVVSIYKKMKSLKIKNVSPEIMEIFKLTGFDKRLDIEA